MAKLLTEARERGRRIAFALRPAHAALHERIGEASHRERVVGMLRGVGSEEIRSVLAERGSVEVRCDFCNRAYEFDSVDVEQIFAAAHSPAPGGTVH